MPKLIKEKREKSDGTAAETRQKPKRLLYFVLPVLSTLTPSLFLDYLFENDKEKTKVIKCKIEWTMFKDIRAFTKVWVQVMKFSKVSTQMRGKNAEVRRRAAQLLNTVRTTGKNRDHRVEFIAMKLKARGVSFEK